MKLFNWISKNADTDKRFFKPFVGDNYGKGINGKKVLVLGASFYCSKTGCVHFRSCTDTQKKDSSPYDRKCPSYAAAGKRLSLEPSYCIEDSPKTYQTFASLMQSIAGTYSYEDTWDRMAFTNYVQFFLPATGKKFRETLRTDISKRDFEALVETVKELKPHIIIVWGCVINSYLREENPYFVSLEELEANEEYLWHIKVPGVDHQIAVVNPYHPSSSAWNSGLHIFRQYLNKALNE